MDFNKESTNLCLKFREKKVILYFHFLRKKKLTALLKAGEKRKITAWSFISHKNEMSSQRRVSRIPSYRQDRPLNIMFLYVTIGAGVNCYHLEFREIKMFQDLIKNFCSSKQLKTCARLIIIFFYMYIYGKSSTSWLGISNNRETNYMFKYYKLIKLYIYTCWTHK